MLTDLQLLKDLVESEKLTDDQEDSFKDLLKKVKSNKLKLTPKQRSWAEDVHSRLGLDPGVENLVSSGQVKVTEAERQSLQTFISSLGPKPLKPPGRK